MSGPELKPGLSGTMYGIPADKLRFDLRTYDICRTNHSKPMYGCPVCFLLLVADQAIAEAASPILRGLAHQYDVHGKATGMADLFAARDQLLELLNGHEAARNAVMGCIVNPKGSA